VEIALQGIGVSPGIAVGHALNFGVVPREVPKYHVDDVDAEKQRFNQALRDVRSDLIALRERLAQEYDESEASIFDAHLMLAEDVALQEEIERRLTEEKLNVEHIVDEYVKRNTSILEALEDARFSERALDVRDVGRRIIEKLLKLGDFNLASIDRPSVIVAHDLTPSDTANLDIPNVLAIAADLGGATSHAAILARAFEIPAVVGLKKIGAYAYPEDLIIVDGTRGRVVVRPEEETLTQYQTRKHQEDTRRAAAIETAKYQESITIDGVHIPLCMNIEFPNEVERGMRFGAEGVGLFRTEYLYLNRRALPTEEEQYQAYAETAAAIKPDPVTFRTLDLGGDKIARSLHTEVEANPQLGWRAIRFCLERTDIFRAQLRALYRASVHGDIRIMFPLITGLDELLQVKEIVADVHEELDDDGVAFRKDVPLGVMIEVPAAVQIADLLAPEVDFFSVGTNDLIQYTLAVDRVNERIAHMFEQAHPAVFRMVRDAVRAAKKGGIPVTICGEMAGNPIFTELLIGLGVDALSMTAVSIPEVRAEVANSNAADARAFAEELLQIGKIPEIKRVLRNRYEKRRASLWYLSQFERFTLETNSGSDMDD